jgi:hypothetical protein
MDGAIIKHLILLVLVSNLAMGVTRRVPAEYSTIQAAIDACVDGDVVLVAPGTYTGDGNRDIDFRGKAITVQSSEPNDPNVVKTTIVDCNASMDNPHRGFNFQSGEGADSLLEGLTIANGHADGGGGIRCDGSSPTIRNCTISNNSAYARYGSNGGGIYCYNSNATIYDCIITDNTAVVWGGHVIMNGYGGAIYCYGGSPNIKGCVISGNIGLTGVYCSNGNLTIANCALSNNSGNAVSSDQAGLIVSNCMVTNNGGSGIYANQGTLAVSNSTIRSNSAYNCGGIFCRGDLTITSSTICDNESEFCGAGLRCEEGTWSISDCMITNNTVTNTANVYGDTGGGGIYCDGGNLVLTNSEISGNATLYTQSSRANYGGGIRCDDSEVRLKHCTIARNYSAGSAGGFCSRNSPDVTIEGCVISGNTAVGSGGGMFNTSSPALTNCVVWGNAPDQIVGSADVSYSNVQGGFPGEGNIGDDPLFTKSGYWADANDLNIAAEPNDPNAIWVDGDYHLKSQAGRWDPKSGTWVQDDVTSPCIDAGDPNSPIGHEPFPNGGIINMGAYGGTAEASKSYFGEPICETIVAGDINGDCKVDFVDFTLMAGHWLEDNTR